MKIRIGTRGSDLALAQSNTVKEALLATGQVESVELIQIKTLGDKKQGTPKAANSDKKDWVYELELGLLENEIDLAVHSGKDCPANIEDGTALCSVLKRESPLDVFIGKQKEDGARIRFDELEEGATVGTASLRRQAQLKILKPSLNIVPHRGNVPTRLRKLEESETLSGIILAQAGMMRLGVESSIQEALPAEKFVPAVAQGSLVVQFRSGDSSVQELCKGIQDEATERMWQAERKCVILLEGDCRSSMAVHARHGEQLSLHARVMLPDGSACIESVQDGELSEPVRLGEMVAEELLSKGAKELIEKSRSL